MPYNFYQIHETPGSVCMKENVNGPREIKRQRGFEKGEERERGH